jgi:curved DNA-binding protein CbpA
MINKAYEVLTDEKSRFKYNLHLQNPEESDYYHEYRYYSNKYIQNPQIDPLLVVLGVLSLVSLLQYVMRAQMYQRAVLSITESHDFRAKVNERCGNNKKIKDTVR